MPGHNGSPVSGLLTLSAILLLALTPAAPAKAELPLEPHVAVYKVKISVLGGKLTTKLTETEGGYRAERVTKPTGLAKIIARGNIEESAEFSKMDNGLRPSHYYSNDEISKEAGETRIDFDWDAGVVTGSHNDLDVSEELNGLWHDRLSIQYELMYDLLNGFPVGPYTLFEVDKIRPLGVEFIGEKKVRVPAGTYDAIGVRHQAEGSSRVTTFWFVKELGYVPAIIERHRKDKLLMQAKLTKYIAL